MRFIGLKNYILPVCTTDKVAIKIVDRSRLDAKNLRMLSREVATLECVQHPYILRLFEVVETFGKVHLVTEFIEGGELYYKIVQNGVYTEAKARRIFRQLALAIQHMVRKISDLIVITKGVLDREYFSPFFHVHV